MLPRLIAIAWLGSAFGIASVHAQSASAWPMEAAGSVEIVKIKEGQFKYRIKNAAGKTVVISPGQTTWETSADVLNVIRELTKTLATKSSVDDPASSEQFKDKEFAYSFRIKNAKGVVVAVPPVEIQWKTKAEALAAMENVKTILQTSKAVEVSEVLQAGPVSGSGGSMPRVGTASAGPQRIVTPSLNAADGAKRSLKK
jgi:uncharacterized protein YegP (UPF0339 family)